MPSTRPPTPTTPKMMPKIAATGIVKGSEELLGAGGSPVDDPVANGSVATLAAGEARYDTRLVNGTLAKKVLHALSAYGTKTT